MPVVAAEQNLVQRFERLFTEGETWMEERMQQVGEIGDAQRAPIDHVEPAQGVLFHRWEYTFSRCRLFQVSPYDACKEYEYPPQAASSNRHYQTLVEPHERPRILDLSCENLLCSSYAQPLQAAHLAGDHTVVTRQRLLGGADTVIRGPMRALG